MLELRSTTFERDGNKLAGYAARYNVQSHPLSFRSINGGRPFREVVAPGAFERSLQGNVSMLVGHDRRELLANTASGLLQLRSDADGLAFEVTLPDTTRARDVRAMVEAGLLTEMSFGFHVKRESWEGTTRTLHDVDLREISVVEKSMAAYPQTLAEARTHHPGIARLRLRMRALS